MAYRSLTAVQPFAGGDLSSNGVLAAAVAARSFNREVILLILTSPMAAWGLNFVFGLHKQGYGHYLVASQTEQHCQALGQAWSALDQPPPPCGRHWLRCSTARRVVCDSRPRAPLRVVVVHITRIHTGTTMTRRIATSRRLTALHSAR